MQLFQVAGEIEYNKVWVGRAFSIYPLGRDLLAVGLSLFT